MKRFGNLVTGLVLASIIAGCDGGIQEGAPKDGPMDPQTSDLKAYMKQNAGNMQPKNPAKPRNTSGSTPAPPAEKKDKP